MDNTAYIDCARLYFTSELTKKDIIPTFPIYYGSLNGISNNFKYDNRRINKILKKNGFIEILKKIYLQLMFIDQIVITIVIMIVNMVLNHARLLMMII